MPWKKNELPSAGLFIRAAACLRRMVCRWHGSRLFLQSILREFCACIGSDIVQDHLRLNQLD